THARWCSAALSSIQAGTRADNRAIARPRVLIVTPHPVIGAGLETVLGLEDLYDLRRVTTLSDAATAAASWPADAALVDGVLLEGRSTALGIPAYVLSRDAERGGRLGDRRPGARGGLCRRRAP